MAAAGGTKKRKDPPRSDEDDASPPAAAAAQGDSSQVTEMLAEIASLKQSVEAWKAAFVEELGLGGKGNEDEDGAFEPAAIREVLRSIRRENEGLTSSLLQTQAKLDEARKEAAYTASSLSPAARAIDKVLMDPGLARQFRHMESEVDQGREMMKEMQDDLVAVTYTADNYEKKQQVERLRTLERENEDLRKGSSHASNTIASLQKQLQQAQQQHRSLQELTRSLDKDYNDLLSKSKAQAAT